jgi:DNA modification methylase
MTHQPELISDLRIPDLAARDAEREAYLERLREHLNDPDFRAIEGFPIGADEDILALSDPPYYTACPNPFLPEIIERWQRERAELREELGLPDDRGDNRESDNGVYHREPFAADVSEGKHSAIYRAHTYHTKVPHKAVMRYILHYTDPGDIVFDGFSGTGMTGVAAQLCGDRREVQQLGYGVDDDGVIYDGDEIISRLGARQAVLVDLSPAAAFIAQNYNNPAGVGDFEQEADRILHEVEEECGWMYQTWHPRCDDPNRAEARINYTVWSDVFLCSQCGEEMTLWDVAVDMEEGRVLRRFPCPGCGAEQSKRDLERAWETVYDYVLGHTIQKAKQVPVIVNYTVRNGRLDRSPDSEDIALVQRINEQEIPYWFPADALPDGYNTRQPMESHGVTSAHHFYTQRNLWVTGALWNRFARSEKAHVRHLGAFALTAAMRYLTRMSKLGTTYYFHGGGGAINAGVLGTLYVPSFSAENNVLRTMRIRLPKLYRVLHRLPSQRVAVSTQSATSLARWPSGAFDYVFVDPPFGGNLMYSELNFLWEAWLGVLTDNETEAIVNDVQGKSLPDYQRLMEQCFREFYRTLKPGRWITIEFHNSKNSVWNAIQEGLIRAGFVVADVRTLDKEQGSFKQVTTASAVKQDLVISAYRPRSGFEQRFLQHGGTPEAAWAFVRQHLEQLPVVVEKDGMLEVVAERQAYLLYDRMVAFHIQRGLSVPMGAAEFYAGLKQRFPERDDMYFLPAQAAEYDRRRLQVSRVEQLALFVTDEKSAIQWLRRELNPETGAGPQTYQDLQPKFLQELHQARHENLPELSEMLAQNFLQDKQDRWYIPDPAHQEDLEKLRERSLLREFREYAQGKGRLQVFRTEAVRAGFKHAWQEHDYGLIIKVAERLPTSVLQEDSSLLMYYDNALTRAAEEPKQGRLL